MSDLPFVPLHKLSTYYVCTEFSSMPVKRILSNNDGDAFPSLEEVKGNHYTTTTVGVETVGSLQSRNIGLTV